MTDANSATFRTCAKINLHLRVLGRREDGYHEIETVLHGIDLCDELTFSPALDGRVTVNMNAGPGIDVTSFPSPENNLVAIAAQKVRDGAELAYGVSIDVEKRIPIGAGLGGGSANAAGVLIALNELWRFDRDEAALMSIAREIGSDVSYCLLGGTALATSRGEIVRQVPSGEDMHFVLGMSRWPLSTKHVYESWDTTGTSGPGSEAMTSALASGDVARIAEQLHNDLEEPAFRSRPELADAKSAMATAGALGSAMSGSGPTIFGIARDAKHASSVAGRVEGLFDRVEIVRSHGVCVERKG